LELLHVAFEVDFDFRFGEIGPRSEAPVLNGILSRCSEKRMAGLDFGAGDRTVGLDGDEQNDSAAYMHAAGELGIAGGDAGDDRAVNIAGKGGSGAEEETSCEEKRAGRSE
jgi:hypothetical protein